MMLLTLLPVVTMAVVGGDHDGDPWASRVALQTARPWNGAQLPHKLQLCICRPLVERWDWQHVWVLLVLWLNILMVKISVKHTLWHYCYWLNIMTGED